MYGFVPTWRINKQSVVGKFPAGSMKPVLFFNDEQRKESFPERSPLESLAVDEENNVWCATWNGIVYWNANDTIPVFKRLTQGRWTL